MSVIVKGMGMPEKCPDCNFESECGFCLAKSPDFCGYTDELVRPDWCPLVELPETHGRLIDADAFFERFMYVDRQISYGLSGLYVDIHDLNEILSSIPTVIEAEGETPYRTRYEVGEEHPVAYEIEAEDEE